MQHPVPHTKWKVSSGCGGCAHIKHQADSAAKWPGCTTTSTIVQSWQALCHRAGRSCTALHVCKRQPPEPAAGRPTSSHTTFQMSCSCADAPMASPLLQPQRNPAGSQPREAAAYGVHAAMATRAPWRLCLPKGRRMWIATNNANTHQWPSGCM